MYSESWELLSYSVEFCNSYFTHARFLRKKENEQSKINNNKKSRFIIGFKIVTKKESVTNSRAAKTENSRSRHWLYSQSIL